MGPLFIQLMISAGIGASFVVLFGKVAGGTRRSLLAGMLYGGIWWILGPLTLMPWMMGMGFGANLSVVGAATALPSLMGHVVYGMVLGFVQSQLARRTGGARAASASASAAPVDAGVTVHG